MILAALLATGGASGAAPPSWPRFHGPKGDNLSSETGLLARWPQNGPKLLWTAGGLGEGYSSLAIADGLIFTAGNVDGKTQITALDMAGKVRWTAEDGPAWTADHPGTRSTPTIDGEYLYYESPLGELACLMAATGKEVWRVNILKKFGAPNIRWALAESPVIDGDHVLCSPGGPKTTVVALDKKTGAMVWKSASAGDAAGYATPAVVQFEGLRIILTLTAKALVGIDADSGELLFRHEHETSYDVNVLTPIFHEGQVFISSGYGSGSELVQLARQGKKVSASRLWQSKELDNHHGGVLLLDGDLYGSAFGGKWVCLDWKTGKTMYADRGVGKGSLTYADGMLYTLSEHAKVGLVKATPEGHKVLSQFTLRKGGEGPSWAHPVVCGGRLYVRHGDFLYVYDVKTASRESKAES
jgi:outer membrane protein assembly factor BamB